jgi:hypothetical protein
MGKLNWLFGWIGLLAFLLAIPMAILANILTPKVQDAWARTSKARAYKRYSSLGKTILQFKRKTEFDSMMDFFRFAVLSLVSGVLMLLFQTLFVSLNQVYIAAINGMKLDATLDLNHTRHLGLLLQGLVLGMVLALNVSLVLSSRHLRLVSSRSRRRYLISLRQERRRLKRQFGIGDNFKSSAQTPLI